ncbi:MAG: hypothetical protein MI725_16110 [Pirellulales bacterium]|nr:hypothetical protein [Pirellulales bacterium]
MQQLIVQVQRARRKLRLQLFLNRLLRCWFAALVVAAVAIAAPKLVVVEHLPVDWTLKCSVAALVSGFLVAGIWTLIRSRSELDAAVEIDRRYGLKERVASSLSLSPQEAESPAGQALLNDAVRAVQRVDVDQQFRIRLDSRPWLPLVPALAVFLIATLAENREAQSSVDPDSQKITQAQHENATKALRERLKKLRKKAAGKKGLNDAEGLFRELEKQAENLSQTRTPDRKKSLVKLNDLAKQLEKRREQLSSKQDLRKQLERMKDINRGPADKMVKAMKQGDWKKAIEELDKLKQQMAAGKLDEQAKKELQEQLKQLQEKMANAAEARQKAMEELSKQIEQQKQQGDLARAGELQQRLDQMQQQQINLDKLNELAQMMGQCQQCMQQGNAEGAVAALGQMMQQMEQLQQDMAEGEMLEAALDQLQMAKDAMRCAQCQGQGCGACGGDKFNEKARMGMGAGRGFGPRPDEKNDVRFRDSRVRQDPRGGSAVVVGEADGLNVRGQVAESIKEQMISVGSDPADPLTVEQLPKSRREHAEEYFNSLREGR